MENDFALEVDAFTTLLAHDARAFETRQILRPDFHADPLLFEELVVGQDAVGFLLPQLFIEFREHFPRALLGMFGGDDADRAAGFEVHEGRGHFAPVEEFQRALAQAAVGHECDRVGHAAVDFHVSDQALAVLDRVFDAQFAQAQHRQPHAQHLAGAQVPVRLLGRLEIFIQCFHFREIPKEY
jgi:hypothetical protein